MNIYNGDVSRLWLISFLLGGILGAVYDAVAQLFISANIKPPQKIVGAWSIITRVMLGIRDILFCILFSFCALMLMYNENKGVFRWSVYFFMLTGYFIYRKALSKFIRKIISLTLIFPMWIMRKALKILSLPIRLIFKLWDLTIGKFVCIIICGIKNKRLSRKVKREEKRRAILPPLAESGKEEHVDIQKAEVRASRVVIRRKDA